jgi:hypothetical protein
MGAGVQGIGVLAALDLLDDGQQGGVLVAGPGRIPRLPGQAGEVNVGNHLAGVLAALDPLDDGQQGSVLVAGLGRIPRLPSPEGEAVPDGFGVSEDERVEVALNRPARAGAWLTVRSLRMPAC